jgi:hypothetical protein
MIIFVSVDALIDIESVDPAVISVEVFVLACCYCVVSLWAMCLSCEASIYRCLIWVCALKLYL